MELNECMIGVIVLDKFDPVSIGHIIGLMVNLNSEVIPIVKFAQEENPRGIHHRNIKQLN